MTALAANRDTPEMALLGDGLAAREIGAGAAAVLYGGALVCLNAAGEMVRGATATTLIALGRSEKLSDNSAGAANAILGKAKPGIYRWANLGGDLLTTADRGLVCYIVDDQTVGKTGTGKSIAGKVVDVDSLGVWVATGLASVFA